MYTEMLTSPLTPKAIGIASIFYMIVCMSPKQVWISNFT